MGLFSAIRSIFAQRQVALPQHPQQAVQWLSRSDAQIFVTEAEATAENVAMACGSLLARTIAMLPAHIQVPRSDDDRDGNEPMRGHPVEGLLRRQANPEMTAMAFRERLMMAAIFHGNAFAEIERDGSGRPVALWGIHPDRVRAMRDDVGALYFEVDNGELGGKVDLPAADMFHLPGPAINGPLGLSLISYGRHTLGLAIAQHRFASSFVANAAAPSGLLKLKSNIQPAGKKRLEEEFKAASTGIRKAGKVIITDAETSFEQIGLNMVDAEFLAQRRFSVEEVCRLFGVPPQMIGDTSKQTFANFEQAGLNFLALAVLPWVTRIEQEANRKLFRPIASRRMPFVKLNTSAIVRANIEARNRSYALGRQWGWLSVNDIRRLEDMPPIGPEGDIYLQPLNMEPAKTDPAPATSDDEATVRQLAQLFRQAAE